MISRVRYLPLVKQESFLRTKYEVERLSPKQIAELTFSSRQIVVKYLERARIKIRAEDRRIGPISFGYKRRQCRITLNTQEQVAIKRAKQLKHMGMSYERVAAVMTAMAVKTKSGGTTWYAKTVRDIILRSEFHLNKSGIPRVR